MIDKMKSQKVSKQLFEGALMKEAIKQSFVKLNPALLIKNPVMFVVWIGTLVMVVETIRTAVTPAVTGDVVYNLVVTVVLFLTVLFANFAEAIAEARGKAQAESLRKTREETPAKVATVEQSGFDIPTKTVSSAQLRKGDVFICEAGPVIRESGGDKSSVTGGTKVLSDRIKVLVTTQPGESFLDKMIALVEGASRQKTPNEIALTILLAGFTLVFIIVCVTLKPFGDYAGTPITIAAFVSLFVCLIPTTIGGLLSAIGIAGMDRALRANVITKSGKAVESNRHLSSQRRFGERFYGCLCNEFSGR